MFSYLCAIVITTQMSDVEAGGRTVFNSIGVGAVPEKVNFCLLSVLNLPTLSVATCLLYPLDLPTLFHLATLSVGPRVTYSICWTYILYLLDLCTLSLGHTFLIY